MSGFMAFLGRLGHVALQIGLTGAQVYVGYLQGGKVSAVNAGVAAVQVLLADQARIAVPPAN